MRYPDQCDDIGTCAEVEFLCLNLPPRIDYHTKYLQRYPSAYARELGYALFEQHDGNFAFTEPDEVHFLCKDGSIIQRYEDFDMRFEFVNFLNSNKLHYILPFRVTPSFDEERLSSGCDSILIDVETQEHFDHGNTLMEILTFIDKSRHFFCTRTLAIPADVEYEHMVRMILLKRICLGRTQPSQSKNLGSG